MALLRQNLIYALRRLWKSPGLVLAIVFSIGLGIAANATVFSMINRDVPIKGAVQGIGWGVTDQDRINIPRSVPYVERSLNWVRVAQRFPVRVRLENPPPELMRLGASAVIEVKHGAACR